MKTANRSPAISGFSLVELLVVLLIIGLAIGVVSVGVGVDKSAYGLRQAAKDFANQTALLAQEAVLSRQQWGVDIYRQYHADEEQFGYRWLLLTEDGWRDTQPSGLEAGQLFPVGSEVALSVEGSEQEIGFLVEVSEAAEQNKELEQEQEQALEPDLWLLSSGEISPFELALNYHDSGWQAIKVTGDQLGRVKVSANDEDALQP